MIFYQKNIPLSIRLNKLSYVKIFHFFYDCPFLLNRALKYFDDKGILKIHFVCYTRHFTALSTIILPIPKTQLNWRTLPPVSCWLCRISWFHLSTGNSPKFRYSGFWLTWAVSRSSVLLVFEQASRHSSWFASSENRLNPVRNNVKICTVAVIQR